MKTLFLCRTTKKRVKMLRNVLCVASLIFLLNPNVSDAWNVTFSNSSLRLTMDEVQQLHVKLSELDATTLVERKARLSLLQRKDLVTVANPDVELDDIVDGVFEHTFNLTGVFLGVDTVYVSLNSIDGYLEISNQSMTVTVLRQETTIDRVFTYSIIALVSILYINFGAALDMAKVKEILVRPIGPLIALVCKFLCMPLVISLFVFYSFSQNNPKP